MRIKEGYARKIYGYYNIIYVVKLYEDGKLFAVEYKNKNGREEGHYVDDYNWEQVYQLEFGDYLHKFKER